MVIPEEIIPMCEHGGSHDVTARVTIERTNGSVEGRQILGGDTL